MFVSRILDGLANALDQSEALLHRRHVRIKNNVIFEITLLYLSDLQCRMTIRSSESKSGIIESANYPEDYPNHVLNTTEFIVSIEDFKVFIP